MVHCCSQDTIGSQGQCFTESLSKKLQKKCFWLESSIVDGSSQMEKPLSDDTSMVASGWEPPFTQFIHWLMINIPAKDNTSKENEDTKKGETVIHYSPLQDDSPKKGSGTHRYAFLLFKQDSFVRNKKI